MRLCTCGEEIDPRRIALGERRCLDCGEAAAQREIEAKGKRVAADYNKGGLVYQGDAATAKRNIQQAGKKNASIAPDIPLGNSYADRLRAGRARPRPNLGGAVGRYTYRGDNYVLFANQQPPAGATAVVLFRSKKP